MECTLTHKTVPTVPVVYQQTRDTVPEVSFEYKATHNIALEVPMERKQTHNIVPKVPRGVRTYMEHILWGASGVETSPPPFPLLLAVCGCLLQQPRRLNYGALWTPSKECTGIHCPRDTLSVPYNGAMFCNNTVHHMERNTQHSAMKWKETFDTVPEVQLECKPTHHIVPEVPMECQRTRRNVLEVLVESRQTRGTVSEGLFLLLL